MDNFVAKTEDASLQKDLNQKLTERLKPMSPQYRHSRQNMTTYKAGGFSR
ncbi:hypothetical protein [Pricia sp.]